MASEIHVRSLPDERFTQSIEAGRHTILADEPTLFGGSDQGPGPYAFLLAALGS